MRTEVIIRVFDPEGRTGQEWAAMVRELVEDLGAEIVYAEDEEV